MNVFNKNDFLEIPEIKSCLAHLAAKKEFCAAAPFCFFPFLTALLSENFLPPVIVICRGRKQTDDFSQSLSAFSEIMGIRRKIFTLWEEPTDKRPPDGSKQLLPLVDILIREKHLPVISVASDQIFENTTLPDMSFIEKHSLTLKTNMTLPMEKLLRTLARMGYERTRYVEVRGEVSQRGGIIDIFPVNTESPLRVEFFGDQVESIRFFSPLDQTGREHVSEAIKVFPHAVPSSDKNIDSLLFPGSLVIIFELHNVGEAFDISKAYQTLRLSSVCETASQKGIIFRVTPSEMLVPYIPSQSVAKTLTDSLQKCPPFTRLLVTAPDEYSLSDLKSLLKDTPFSPDFFLSRVPHGFYWKDKGILLLTFDDVYKKYATQRFSKAPCRRHVFESITESLRKGDIVVHTQYGLGRFVGVTRLKRAEGAKEHIVIEYADKARLYVPHEQFYMVQKYIGLQKKEPPLDSLHSKKWSQKKKRVQEDLFVYAAELLKLEAERNVSTGFSFTRNTDWVREFENSFFYEDTPDQKKTTREVFEDMEKARPMDRLVLGDVGYGKTEIAIRAAFKAAVNEKQTAVLVPTTILAEQHGHTFRERMADFPLRIEVLSRFQTAQRQKDILCDLAGGSVDIIIGTHRLLQKDVRFKDLGLLIIDEEQKFGVRQKNLIKNFRKSVDILTLSATPIPRTLYLSLMGTRNISLIQTPPLDRKPIKTIVIHSDKKIIRQAIETEMQRGGQTYIIHNRIQTISGVARWVRDIVPKARIAVAHGRMEREELKEIMEDFYAGKTDVLISTIIIQSGIDIQNVNTMIIHNADMFGLADLYQLRGRIGRADKLAYCYFLISRERMGDNTVQERIQAIREFSSPGGHFKVALKDLEIRGAGNILGTKQSGHIAIIGFDLYCKLLDDTMKTLKGQEVTPLFEVTVDIGVPFFLPTNYIPDFFDRFHFYKKAYSINHEKQIEDIRIDMQDRFGNPCKEAVRFLKGAQIKWLARRQFISRIQVRKDRLFFYRNNLIVKRKDVSPQMKKNSD
ncbi:MAG: transcription-repair coupling factor, partial [Candidatus Aureabacteria bacterium]|nr:transcription-repair coupling factor [Candidatus Auribacterota bacterium]